MSTRQPILVTGAAGQVGGIGGLVVSILLGRQVPVRAFVRRDDDRADALRRAGAEIFVGDLTRTEDVARALDNLPACLFRHERLVQLSRGSGWHGRGGPREG